MSRGAAGPGACQAPVAERWEVGHADEGYAAGYYSYLWAEVMDADAFEAFEETGDPFDAATAALLRTHVLSAGGRQEAEDAYTAFRGKLPGVEPLLRGRGLLPDAA